MTLIESEEAVINKPQKEIFEYLCNFNNFQKLMPEQVTDWQSTENDCSFTIKGMASLGMEIAEKTPHSLIKIIKKGKAPFDFELFCYITAESDTTSKFKLTFNADLNPMLKMLAEKPLKKFLDTLVFGYQKLNVA